MILDYSEYIERHKTKGLFNGQTIIENITDFYNSMDICPICNNKTKIEYNADSGETYPDWLDGSYR